jgi:pyrroloquinoline quinone (PQQ) biosynthesis protein C
MDFHAVTDNVTSDSWNLDQLRQQLFHHPLYAHVQNADSLRLFMREHVFAVWDFMSLLKRLQQLVTCCNVPWLPPADPAICRFINEIVLGEECDEDGRGGYASHFELYLDAMDDVGADARPIRSFLSQLRDCVPFDRALEQSEILPGTRDFVRSTMDLTIHGQPCEIAAAFFYGREDVIPDMFARLVKSLPHEHVSVDRLVHYLNRHIELDGDSHGPLARRLVQHLVGGDPVREQRARRAARVAIQSRMDLWTGILNAMPSDELKQADC